MYLTHINAFHRNRIVESIPVEYLPVSDMPHKLRDEDEWAILRAMEELRARHPKAEIVRWD